MNRILATLRETPDDGSVTLSLGFKRDMAWFHAFLAAFNGKVYFNKQLQVPITDLYVDACLTGVGGPWRRLEYALPLSRIPFLPTLCTIVHLEMINIFIGLNLWKHRLTV